jgi:hypothetical protein
MTAFREDVKGSEKSSLEFLASLPILGPQPKSEKEEKYLREVCEFEFLNLEEPGVYQKFSYGSTKKHKTITLFHGTTYKLPRFIARHLENCATPMYEWKPDGTGRMVKQYVGRKPRFQMRQSYGMV